MYISQSLSVTEIGKALDEFYKTAENLPVPIIWGMRVVALRSNGGGTVEIEKLITKFRKTAATETR